MRRLHIFILKFIDHLMKNHTQGDQNQPRQTNNYLDLNLNGIIIKQDLIQTENGFATFVYLGLSWRN